MSKVTGTVIPGIKDASRTAGGYYGTNLSSSVHGDYRSMTGFCQNMSWRQIHLTRHFSHAVCTIHFMHITLHGSSVCMRASFHLHAIHDERLIVRSLSVSSCLCFSCFSPLFTSSLPHSACTLTCTPSSTSTAPREATAAPSPNEEY